MRDIEVRVGATENTVNSYCGFHAGPITALMSANIACSAPIWGRFVRVQRKTPNYVDYLDFCEVNVYIRESKNTCITNATAVRPIMYSVVSVCYRFL